MSRNRNRNQKFEISSYSQAINNKYTTTPTNGPQIDSGIELEKERNLQYYGNLLSSDCGSDIFTDEFSTGKSTSSSLSWAEDCDNDHTKLVTEEYERMLRVLQRLEPIPSNYDKDEYKLWIKTFPCLSLIDRHSASSTNTIKNCCTSPTKNSQQINKTSAVINNNTNLNNYDKSTTNLNNNNQTVNNKTKINTTLNPMTLGEDLFSFLTISNTQNITRKSAMDNRTTTLNSRLSTQNYKHFPEEETDFTDFNSLPPLLNRNPSNEIRVSSRNKRRYSAMKRNSDFLPPLHLNITSSLEDRTMSSRDYLTISKCPSAFTVRSNNSPLSRGNKDILSNVGVEGDVFSKSRNPVKSGLNLNRRRVPEFSLDKKKDNNSVFIFKY